MWVDCCARLGSGNGCNAQATTTSTSTDNAIGTAIKFYEDDLGADTTVDLSGGEYDGGSALGAIQSYVEEMVGIDGHANNQDVLATFGDGNGVRLTVLFDLRAARRRMRRSYDGALAAFNEICEVLDTQTMQQSIENSPTDIDGYFLCPCARIDEINSMPHTSDFVVRVYDTCMTYAAAQAEDAGPGGGGDGLGGGAIAGIVVGGLVGVPLIWGGVQYARIGRFTLLPSALTGANPDALPLLGSGPGRY